MVIYLKIIFKHLFYIEYYIFLLLCNTDLEYSILLFRIKNKDILNLYIMTMEKYRQFISLLSDNHIDRVFLNSDEKHAIEVFVKLLKRLNLLFVYMQLAYVMRLLMILVI